MKIFTTEQFKKLLANALINRERQDKGQNELDLKPVVKLFMPDGGATWLLTEINPAEPDIAFGLCDLGMGCPELGYVSISEITSVRGRLGLRIERDLHFQATKTLSEYAEEARQKGCVMA